jgi:hypothetical protein
MIEGEVSPHVVRRRGPQKKYNATIPNWHNEEEAARLLGEHLQTRRRRRRAGIGPKCVLNGREWLYPDGAEAAYLDALLQQKMEPPRRRGRPRKVEVADVLGAE